MGGFEFSLYPEFESSNQKSEVFDSYEISSPYFSMTIPNDLNSTAERMIVYLDRANCQIRGSVKDLDGIPIPGAVMTKFLERSGRIAAHRN